MFRLLAVAALSTVRILPLVRATMALIGLHAPVVAFVGSRAPTTTFIVVGAHTARALAFFVISASLVCSTVAVSILGAGQDGIVSLVLALVGALAVSNLFLVCMVNRYSLVVVLFPLCVLLLCIRLII